MISFDPIVVVAEKSVGCLDKAEKVAFGSAFHQIAKGRGSFFVSSRPKVRNWYHAFKWH